MTGRDETEQEKGLDLGPGRVIKAFGYSMDGLAGAWRHEAPFRLEAIAAIFLVPGSLFFPVSWLEHALLVASVLLVMMVELVNCGIESAIDRISLERHPLSKRAKDAGSAAVLFALAIAVLIWGAILLPLATRP